jgi:hypothetical protein
LTGLLLHGIAAALADGPHLGVGPHGVERRGVTKLIVKDGVSGQKRFGRSGLVKRDT